MLYKTKMEFPIEIQRLINDYARPRTRPDWRKGSYIRSHYRSWGGQLGRLNYDEFKEYLTICSELINNDPMFEDIFKMWADIQEKRGMDDIDVHNFRVNGYQD